MSDRNEDAHQVAPGPREISICWDTETTGVDAGKDRIVEVAAVELCNLMPTGRTYHTYVNPERDVEYGAFKVHGLDREFLSGHPTFDRVVDEVTAFFGDRPMVAHNAPFDVKMFNAELARLGRPPLANRSIDTLVMAKKKFPGSPVSLDSLCRRFGFDISGRQKHSALLDTQLLASVYLELLGGRHHVLNFNTLAPAVMQVQRPYRTPRALGRPSPDDMALHEEFIKGIKASLWAAKDYQEAGVTPRP